MSKPVLVTEGQELSTETVPPKPATVSWDMFADMESVGLEGGGKDASSGISRDMYVIGSEAGHLKRALDSVADRAAKRPKTASGKQIEHDLETAFTAAKSFFFGG